MINQKTMNQAEIQDLILAVHTLPTLWKTLAGKHEDLITKAQDAQVEASRFLHEVKVQ